MTKIRVLIIDDSALVRKLLTTGLSRDPHIEVIGAARDPFAARDILKKEHPDVITLDVEMPGMDGVTFLKQYMPVQPIPTVIVSSLTEQGKQITLDALEAGAVDVVLKPKVGLVDGIPVLMGDLVERIKAAALVDVSRYARLKLPAHSRPTPITETFLGRTTDQVIAIGASAGGVGALDRIIPMFPPAAPGIVIVQHMPAGFTSSFAARLNSMSAIQVKEAEEGDRIRPGLALMGPGGDRHIEVYRSGGEYRVQLRKGEKVSGHCPSVDALFKSVARQVGNNAAAALLTGMGADGAEGLLAIRRAGGRTFAQNEETCVVFGMPRVAWEKGGAEALLALDDIPARLLHALK